MFTCSKCNLSLKTKAILQKHYEIKHKGELYLPVQGDYNKYVNKCILGCKISFYYRKDLIKHLDDKHDITIKKEQWIFVSFQEFTTWLNKIIIKEDCNYVQRSPEKRNGKIVIDLICSYSACSYRKPKRHINTKSRASRGTKKLNFACTSHISVTCWSNNVTSVEYWTDHYGHLGNLTSLNLARLYAFRKSLKKPCSKTNGNLNCTLKTKKSMQLTASIKQNLVKSILNLRYLNDYQLHKVYMKSVYLKKFVKEIKIHQEFGIHDIRTTTKRQSLEKPITTDIANNKNKTENFLDEFLIFRRD